MRSIIKYLTESTKFDPVKNKDGVYSKSGVWNDILWIRNKPYRERAEVLILNDNNEVFLEIRGNDYRLPGGSIERLLKRTGKKQVYEEAKEEARIIIKDTIDSGVIYKIDKPPAKWEIDEGLSYEGKITSIYIAKYDKQYKGFIHKIDRDDKMVKNGKFYPLSKLTNKYHIKAIKKVFPDLAAQNMKMYRSGHTQNIKMFNPKNPDKAHNKQFRSKNLIYATNNPSYAAGFCFDWFDKEGFRFGRINQNPWLLEMPKKYKNRLNQKCSFYELESASFKKIDVRTPEYYSEKSVKVIKEIKFDSCYDCLEKYKVQIRFI